jgi:hypothetical protein
VALGVPKGSFPAWQVVAAAVVPAELRVTKNVNSFPEKVILTNAFWQ